jgi:hypothetical protein
MDLADPDIARRDIGNNLLRQGSKCVGRRGEQYLPVLEVWDRDMAESLRMKAGGCMHCSQSHPTHDAPSFLDLHPVSGMTTDYPLVPAKCSRSTNGNWVQRSYYDFANNICPTPPQALPATDAPKKFARQSCPETVTVVGRYRLTLSNSVLKAPVVYSLEPTL